MEYVNFQYFILPWVGKDTYLLYAPVCRAWAAAYAGATVTHPRHLVADCATYQRFCTLDCIDIYAARYAPEDVLALIPTSNSIHLGGEAAVFDNVAGVSRFRSVPHRCEYDMMILAIKYGCMSVISYLFADYDLDNYIYSDEVNTAASAGRVEVLEWLEEKGWPFADDDIKPASEAAKMGHQHVLDWLDLRGYQWRGNDRVCTSAAEGGQLALLQKLITENCAFSSDSAFEIAIEYGHLHVAKWIERVYRIEPEPTYLEAAALGWQREAAVWLRSLGCEWSVGVYREALTKLTFELPSDDNAPFLDMFEWLLVHGCPVSPTALTECLTVRAYDIMPDVITWFTSKGVTTLESVEPDDLYKTVMENACVNAVCVMSMIFNMKCPMRYKSLMKWCIQGSQTPRNRHWRDDIVRKNKKKAIDWFLDNMLQIVIARHVLAE